MGLFTGDCCLVLRGILRGEGVTNVHFYLQFSVVGPLVTFVRTGDPDHVLQVPPTEPVMVARVRKRCRGLCVLFLDTRGPP